MFAGLFVAAWMGSSAMAGSEVSLGLSLGVGGDLGDRASAGQTRLGVGPTLSVPLRVRIVDPVRFRADLSLTEASGLDQLTWTGEVEGVPVRFTDDDGHLAIFGGLGLTVGFEAQVPLAGRARPYLALDAGVMGVGMFHALREASSVLLDPEQNDVGNPRNLDPYTIQATVVGDLALGTSIRATDRLEVFVEFGYSSAFVGPKALRKTPSEADARREAFAFNPLRGTVGLAWRL